MERFLMADLEKWKSSSRRKPLILNGARQVGKTWLLKEFGSRNFKNTVYINLDNNEAMKRQFDEGYDVKSLMKAMEIQSGERIAAGETLIILDEIQECPKALTALKYFCENAPEQAIASAGSLLGITVHEGTGYPVGKVDTLDLYPLNFREFLIATDNAMLCEAIGWAAADTTLIDSFSAKLISLLKEYYFVGGMPEVVASFIRDEDYDTARTVQDQILAGYERDFSKHLNSKETEAVLSIWRSIPAHLGQENKRFVFGHIKKGARARDYRSAITWLSHAGLAEKVDRVAKPSIPLSAYADGSIFKLFVVDVGLLGAMTGLDVRSVIEGNAIFTEFKGALTEQYVCQQLVSDCHVQPFYWSAENSRGEIDFLVQMGSTVCAIEVKAEENLRAKSLRAFKEKYSEVIARRFSLSGFRREEWMVNVPLYAIGERANWQ